MAHLTVERFIHCFIQIWIHSIYITIAIFRCWMACIILLALATFTLARPAQENQPMPIRFCGRDLIRAIDEVCVAIKSPAAAFIDPVALNQSSSLADSESGLLIFSWSEKRHSIDNLNFCLQPTLSWESGRNWKTRKAIRFCVSVAWLAARRTTWILSARSTGIKCKCFLGEFRYCCKSLTMNLIDRMGAAMHLRSQEWNMDWLYEFLPRYGDVPTNA